MSPTLSVQAKRDAISDVGDKELFAGITVLVARPRGQGENLCSRLRAVGAVGLLIPAIEVYPLPVDLELRRVAHSLSTYDAVLFVSVNAVEWGMTWLSGLAAVLPPRVLIGAVGQSTAQALLSRGVAVTALPQVRYDSEGLLALPSLQQVTGKRILIVRGRGGREVLAAELRSRGAHVDYAEVYARRCPAGSLREKLPAPGQIDVVVATSNEIIDNLLTLAGTLDRAWLCGLPLVVFSERNSQHAQACGFSRKPYVASSMSDEGVIDALRTWAAERAAQ